MRRPTGSSNGHRPCTPIGRFSRGPERTASAGNLRTVPSAAHQSECAGFTCRRRRRGAARTGFKRTGVQPCPPASTPQVGTAGANRRVSVVCAFARFELRSTCARSWALQVARELVATYGHLCTFFASASAWSRTLLTSSTQKTLTRSNTLAAQLRQPCQQLTC
jgi:hypothetical protein